MRTIRFAILIFIGVVLAASAWAEVAVTPAPAVDKVSLQAKIASNELRTYKVNVHMTGRMAGEDAKKLVDVEAFYSMNMLHRYGIRENDGLVPLEISVANAEVTIGAEKMAMPSTDHPKLTLLLDRAWKVTNLFGVAGTRYASQAPGLNYANLIMLFFVPDGTTPHAIGESWSSKIKLPSIVPECAVKTTLKSIGGADSPNTIVVAQEYTWPEQKLDRGSVANSKATVESVFALDTGKLLKSHAESHVILSNSADPKQEKNQEQANTKIDILLEK